MLRIAFMQEESSRIHCDSIGYDNIPKLSKNYWMHPVLRRALQLSYEETENRGKTSAENLRVG